MVLAERNAREGAASDIGCRCSWRARRDKEVVPINARVQQAFGSESAHRIATGTKKRHVGRLLMLDRGAEAVLVFDFWLRQTQYLSLCQEVRMCITIIAQNAQNIASAVLRTGSAYAASSCWTHARITRRRERWESLAASFRPMRSRYS